jgi:hypothetical protein
MENSRSDRRPLHVSIPITARPLTPTGYSSRPNVAVPGTLSDIIPHRPGGHLMLSSYSPRFGVPAPWTPSNITPRRMPVRSGRIWDFRTVHEAQDVEPTVDSTPTDSSTSEAAHEASEICRLASFDSDEELSDDDLANMPVYMRRTVQHGLIGNTCSEQSIPSPCLSTHRNPLSPSTVSKLSASPTRSSMPTTRIRMMTRTILLRPLRLHRRSTVSPRLTFLRHRLH